MILGASCVLSPLLFPFSFPPSFFTPEAGTDNGTFARPSRGSRILSVKWLVDRFSEDSEDSRGRPPPWAGAWSVSVDIEVDVESVVSADDDDDDSGDVGDGPTSPKDEDGGIIAQGPCRRGGLDRVGSHESGTG